MKNKLSYLIGVACLLSYTGTFTSCVNGVDDEYLEQKFTESGGTDNESEELPDLNGDYSIEGDYELVMTCNGELLEGKKVVMAVDETNESASFTFAAAQTDLETVIATSIPGGIGGLVSGWGLKYTGNSPVPGEKEITVANVPLFRNGTQYYMFEGSNIQPTYTMTFNGKIEGEKMTIDINYELTNQKLAGTWELAPVFDKNNNDNSPELSPLWLDWDSNIEADLGAIQVEMMPGHFFPLSVKGKMNGIFNVISTSASAMVMEQIAGIKLGIEPMLRNLLQSITTKPNGGMYAIYSYSGDLQNPQWSGSDGMPHNAMRYYYDPEKPDERIYLELNSGFLINLIESLAAPAEPAAPGTRADLRDVAKELIALLVPLLEDGIPCEYKLEGNNLTINIDGIVLKNILVKLMVVANDPSAKEVLDGLLGSLGDFKDNITKLLAALPAALEHHDFDGKDYSGECKYVKIGLKFVKK